MLTFDNISAGLQEKKNIYSLSGSFFHFSRPFNFFHVNVLNMKSGIKCDLVSWTRS